MCTDFVNHSKLNSQHNRGGPLWPPYGSLSVDFEISYQFDIRSKIYGIDHGFFRKYLQPLKFNLANLSGER